MSAFPNILIGIVFMSTIFLLGALALVLGIKEVKSHSAKYNIFDSLFSFLIGMFDSSGIGEIIVGIFLMVIAVVVIINR